jgi:hypothetical protein
MTSAEAGDHRRRGPDAEAYQAGWMKIERQSGPEAMPPAPCGELRQTGQSPKVGTPDRRGRQSLRPA